MRNAWIIATATIVLAAHTACCQELPRLFDGMSDEQGAMSKLAQALSGTDAAYNVVRGGVVLDDPTVDNGPALNKIFSQCGTQVGNIREAIYLPGGAIYFSTPIVLPPRSGIAIRCNGTTIRYPEAAYSGRTQSAGPASRLVYVGDPGRAALTVSGAGIDIQGTLVLQNGPVGRDRKRAANDGTIGLLMDCLKTPPTGKMRADGITVMGFDVGFCAVAKEGGSHGDNNQIVNFRIENCNQGLQVAENQAVGWQIGYCQASGYVENIFQFLDGGDFQCQFLKVTTSGPTRVLDIGTSRSNSCQYQIFKIKVDNSARGWRLVRMQKPGMIDLFVRGLIGLRAAPAADAIDIPKSNGQFIDVDMFWNGKRWPSPQ